MEFFSKIKSALTKTSEKISTALIGKKVDEEFIQQLENALIMADVGYETANELSKKIVDHKFPRDYSMNDVMKYLSNEIAEILLPYESKFFEKKFVYNPYIIFIVGVNGNGKTTTTAKIANILKKNGHNPLLVAADTFRAAAVEQLTYWAEKIGVDICKGKPDPSALVYESIQQAKANGNDVVLVDTAGRMQNRDDLLDELEKIKRVMKKLDSDAPHLTILVIDGLTGQAAYNQVDVFHKKIGVDGIIITKLDGTAKGGALIALTKKYGIKIIAISIGEKINDLKIFNAKEYANAILGID